MQLFHIKQNNSSTEDSNIFFWSRSVKSYFGEKMRKVVFNYVQIIYLVVAHKNWRIISSGITFCFWLTLVVIIVHALQIKIFRLCINIDIHFVAIIIWSCHVMASWLDCNETQIMITLKLFHLFYKHKCS